MIQIAGGIVLAVLFLALLPAIIAGAVWTAAVGFVLDDRFHETGLDDASIHGTGNVLVDSSFEKI